MDRRTVLQWWIRYRLLAALAFLVGAAIAGAGVWLGIRDAVQFAILNLVGEPDFVKETLARVHTGLMAGLVVTGILVWQVGKTVAFYVTIGKLIESEAVSGRAEETRTGPEDGREPDPTHHGDERQDRPPSEATGSARTSSGTGSASPGTAADRDAGNRNAPDRDTARRATPDRDAAGQDAVDGDSARGDAPPRDAAERETTLRDADHGEPPDGEVPPGDAPPRDAAERETTLRDADGDSDHRTPGDEEEPER